MNILILTGLIGGNIIVLGIIIVLLFFLYERIRNIFDNVISEAMNNGEKEK